MWYTIEGRDVQLFIMISLTITIFIKIKWIVFCIVPAWSKEGCEKVVIACLLKALQSYPLHQPISKRSQQKLVQEEHDSLVRVNVCLTVVIVTLWGLCCTQSDIIGHCEKGQSHPPIATSVSKPCLDVVQIWVPAKGTVLFFPLSSVPIHVSLLFFHQIQHLCSWRVGQTNLLILWKNGLLFTGAWGWLVAQFCQAAEFT